MIFPKKILGIGNTYKYIIPQGDMRFSSYTHPLLLIKHYASSSPNIVNLTARLQPSSADHQQGFSPHVNWSLKQHQKPLYRITRRRKLASPPKCNISTRPSESPCHCRRNTHTQYFFNSKNIYYYYFVIVKV